MGRRSRPGTSAGVSLPRRWAHVQGVAARARSLAPVLGADADLLQAAAWLHDIGYAPALSLTGLHALDGADVLVLEFEPAPYLLSSVLTCCDMTTSPDGELVPAEQRLAEIHHRYGPGHLVSRSIQRATPMILRAVEQVYHRAARTTELRGQEAAKYSHDTSRTTASRGPCPGPGSRTRVLVRRCTAATRFSRHTGSKRIPVRTVL